MRLIIPQAPGCSFYLLSRAALCGAPDAFHIMEQLCDILTIPGVDLQLRTLFGAHDLPETNESLTEVIQIIFHTVWCDEDTVFSFDCEEKKWYPWNSDSYWELYESEIMLTVMRSFSPEQAVKILEEKKAFCQV